MDVDYKHRGHTKYEKLGGLTFTHTAVFEKKAAKINTTDSFTSNLPDVMINEMRQIQGQFAHFGADNMLHLELGELISNNSILGELLDTKGKFIKGRKIIAYREIEGKKVEIKDGPVADFMFENDVQELMLRFALDMAYFNNIYPEYIFNRKGDKINRLNHLRTQFCRVSLNRKWIGHGNWNKGYPTNLKTIPTFDYRKFLQGTKTYRKAAEHICFYSPLSNYYGIVNYLFARIWIEYSNKIPFEKLYALLRSSKLKYHIEYPEDYFSERYPSTEINPNTGKNYCQEDWDEIEKKVKLKIDEQLSNLSESEATIMTAIKTTHDGKEIRWKITAIKTYSDDKANLEGWQNSHDALTSSTGFPAELASIRTGEKLGAGGSAVKNQFNYVLEKLAHESGLIVKPLYTIKKVNKWERDVEFGSVSSEMVSTDQSKSGKAKEETIT